MDYNNDGRFELYFGDNGDPVIGGGDCIKSFNADDLSVNWVVRPRTSQPWLDASANLIQLIDVTGDGVRDLVIVTRSNDSGWHGGRTGVAVVDASDGSLIRFTSLELSSVLSTIIYDIDKDGNPEVIGSGDRGDNNNYMTVFDLINWTKEFEVALTEGARSQPGIGDVTGDGYMEILVPDETAGGLVRVYRYNPGMSTYEHLTDLALAGSGEPVYPTVIDLDNDGLNEIIVSRYSGHVTVFDTDAPALAPSPRGNLKHFSEYRLGAPEFVSFIGLSNELPARDSVGQPLNPTLSIDVINYQNKPMDITFYQKNGDNWDVIQSYAGVGDGTYTAVPTDMNDYLTEYEWRVYATDGYGGYQEGRYKLTTGKLVSEYPLLSDEYPQDGAVGTELNPTLSIDVLDQQSDLMDITFETDATGSWQVIQTYTDVADGTYTAATANMNMYSTTYNWRVEADDGNGHVTTETYSFTTSPEPGTWYDMEWQHRKEIVLDHAMADADLTNFPLLFDVTDSDLADHALANGDDILFVDGTSGLKLDHEMELYESGTGHLLAWVEIPLLSSTSDTIVYIYYGNPYSGPQANASGVWGSHYRLVLHLNEASGTHYDSTSYGNDGTYSGSSQDAAGIIGGADGFVRVSDTEGDYVDCGNAPSLNLDDAATVSAWIRPDEQNGWNHIVTKGNNTDRTYQLSIETDRRIDFKINHDVTSTTTALVPLNEWSYVVGTYDLSNIKVYINGVESASEPYTASINDNTVHLRIGSRVDGTGDTGGEAFPFNGLIDEVRVSNPAHSSEWISAEYSNQHAPGTFYSVGPQQTGGCPVISDPVPVDEAVGVPVTISELQFSISDPDVDLMDYAVTTSPGIGSDSASGVGDGTYSVAVSGLAYATTYTWQVEVFDGNCTTNRSFSFTTEAGPVLLTVTLDSPAEAAVLDYNDVLFECDVTSAAAISDVSLYTDISGTWQLMETKYEPGSEYSYDPNMQLWMHLNKDSEYGETDTYVYDFSGNGRDGTITGAAFTSGGKFGGAYDFDGSDDVISLPNDSYGLPGRSGASMAAWVNPAAGQTAASGTVIFLDRGSSASSTRMLISVNNDQTVSVKGRSAGETFQVTNTTETIPLGEWSHIVGMIDLSTNSAQVYIDGELSIDDPKAFTQTTFDNTTTINAGVGAITGFPQYAYKGLIDEIAIYDRLLGPGEITDMYGGSPTQWHVSFLVEDIPAGTYNWNCVAHDIDTNEDWGDANRTITVIPPLVVEYVEPTPDDGATVYTGDVTIQVASNRELADANLEWVVPGAEGNNTVEISIDENLRDRWGFKYPVTYVMDLVGTGPDAEVWCRDTIYDPWQLLEEKTATDFFNGIQCVRFDESENKAYVSVSFGDSNTIYLKFENIAAATFSHVADYYDNRRAAYTLSNDNWGKVSSAHPGATFQGMTNDASDNYQASIHACRMYNIPVSIGINSQMAGGTSMWDRMQEELDVADYAWEPAIHTRTHPCSGGSYSAKGYASEIIGCSDDILANLVGIPYGQYVFEFILPCGYQDSTVESTSSGEFLFLRDWDGSDHPSSTDYAPWNSTYSYYGIGGFQTKSYDSVLQSRSPSGRYYESDVNELNSAFDAVYDGGGIFYAMFHADRYQNSVIYDTSAGVDGVSGSSLMHHWAYVGNRTNVWYVANGWLYSYKMVADNVQVLPDEDHNFLSMTIVNDGPNTTAYYSHTDLPAPRTYHYKVYVTDVNGTSVEAPTGAVYRSVTVEEPVVPGPWWDTDWQYRKSVLIDHTEVVADLNDFAVLVELTDSNIAANAQIDGNDLVFADYDANVLSHEIELYESYDGHLIAWVNVPSLSSIEDTALYLYYGNPVAGSQEDIAGTWNSHYRMVLHLDETSGLHYDSTVFGNDGSYYGSYQDTNGVIDGADYFDGDYGANPGDYIDCGNDSSLDITGAITLSAWINPSDQTNWNHLVTKGADNPNRVYQLSINADEQISFVINADSTAMAETTTAVPVGEWSYVAGTYDRNNLRVYINGEQQAVAAKTEPINVNTVHLRVASRVAGTGDTGNSTWTFDGYIDEVRLSDTAHDANWILTEYNNQSDPCTFTTAGPVETQEGFIITATAGAGGSIDPNGAIVKTYDSNQVFTASADLGYTVDTWYVDGSDVQTGGAAYTLENIQASHTVHVTFKRPVVPDVIGMTEADALAAIEAVEGLLSAVTYEYHATVPAYTVISQDPAGGSEADVGTTVNLAVSLGQVPFTVLGGHRLVQLQNEDGGWDIPLDDGNPGAGSDDETFGWVATGLAQAYRQSRWVTDPNMLAAVQKTKVLLMSKTDNFAVQDGMLAFKLDTVLGGTECVDYVMANFYDKLAAGTYYDARTAMTHNTNTFVQALRERHLIGNIAAWELGVGLYSASVLGVDTNEWVAGVKAEVDELDGLYNYDVLGLAGAVLGLAAAGEDCDPQAGQHADANSLSDLAEILADYQLDTGGFTWYWAFMDEGQDEAVRETAYAVLALNEFDRAHYLNAITGAVHYIQNAQLATGGWKEFPEFVNGDEHNQVTGEAIWGAVEALLPKADFDENGFINFKDFAVFGSAWLSWPGGDGWDGRCNIGTPPDSSIDLLDLAVFVNSWLATVE
jgi:hypothetical protein